MNVPIIILGGGGHAKVLIEAIRLCSMSVIGIIEADSAKNEIDVFGVRVIGGDESISGYDPKAVRLVNAVGSVGRPVSRIAVFEKFKEKGFMFATVIHPSATMASDVVLGEGAQIMAGVVIQPGVTIGANAIVNTGALIDHDCMIGDHVHLGPGVTLSGGVRVADSVHIGTGATLIQGVTIGLNSVVGAGSVVIHAVPDNVEVAGVPAKKIVKKSLSKDV